MADDPIPDPLPLGAKAQEQELADLKAENVKQRGIIARLEKSLADALGGDEEEEDDPEDDTDEDLEPWAID